MYIHNYSSEPNRKKIFSYVVLFFVALCFSNPFYLLPHFYVRYMHSYFRKAVCVILDVMLYEFIMNVYFPHFTSNLSMVYCCSKIPFIFFIWFSLLEAFRGQ